MLCVLAFALAYPLRLYVSQRGQINQLEAQERGQQERVARFQQDVLRYSDPSFVRSEARRRLHFVVPGEQDYQLAPPSPRPGASSGVAQAAGGVHTSWYGQLWRSIESAGRSSGR